MVWRCFDIGQKPYASWNHEAVANLLTWEAQLDPWFQGLFLSTNCIQQILNNEHAKTTGWFQSHLGHVCAGWCFQAILLSNWDVSSQLSDRQIFKLDGHDHRPGHRFSELRHPSAPALGVLSFSLVTRRNKMVTCGHTSSVCFCIIAPRAWWDVHIISCNIALQALYTEPSKFETDRIVRDIILLYVMFCYIM